MANASFSFEPFDFNGIQGGYVPFKGYEKEEVVISKGKQDHLFGMEEDWGEVDSFCSEYSCYLENMAEKGVHLYKDQQQQQQQQHNSDYWMLGDFHFSAGFPPVQPVQETMKVENIKTEISELVETKKENPCTYSLASLELLSNYGSRLKMKGKKLSNLSNVGGTNILSTEEIMRVAGSRYIQFSTQRDDDFAILMHPFGFALSGLSEEETKDVELAHLLLAAAEKVGYQQFDRASRLLTGCEWTALNTGNPVQRIVFYFAEALRERIDRETGRFASKGLWEKGRNEMDHLMLNANPTFLACHQELPFSQVTQFTGIQAIIENVASRSKVHLIDLEIRSGVQWTVLMQALAERDGCPIELLKITAVGTTCKQKIEETGKRLASVAESMNLPFSFKVVFVSDMKDIKEELFEIEADEAVVVYSSLILRTMISRPNCMETLMRVIRKLNPTIMVVTEVEANHNSPSFVNRFIEALFFYSAFFDCLEECMSRANQYRMITEALYLGKGIQNIVATEGEERSVRNVKIDVWRAFFARFGMVEIEFSEGSLYQASLIVKQFACGSSCTLDNNGKCLIVGWKGTPIHSLSAWRFY